MRARRSTVSDGTDDVWGRIAARLAPGASVLRSWDLAGGLSSAMTVLDVRIGDGSVQRVVVRRARRPGGSALAVPDEYRLLTRLHAAGLAVPRPRLLDDSGTILPLPYAVLDFVEGAPRFTTDAPERTGRAFAARLAAIHDVDPSVADGAGLRLRAAATDRLLAEPLAVLDDGLQEGSIREALRAHRARLHSGPVRLLHGDLWPGNVLWAGDDIVAVIDWQSATLGDPLADLAVSRLDLLWAFGPDALTAFTAGYAAHRPVDRTALPVWDLVAALRPAGSLSAWAADWADFGRPDVTSATMRAAHRWFVDRALAELAGSGG